MSISLPINTIILIIAAMIVGGSGWWYNLSQGLRRALAVQRGASRLRGGLVLLLSGWFLGMGG